MKKLSIVFIILVMLFSFGYMQNLKAQQNSTSPLLMQQNQSIGVSPVGIGVPPVPPGTPPLPLGQAGIPIVQTIPTQTLLSNLQQAITTSGNLNKLLTVGKVWLMRSPTGEIEIKAGILYQGAVVAVIHLNPLDGSVLPLGINPHVFQNNVEINAIKSNLSSIIRILKILPIAEFMEPEACWSFAMTTGNITVAHIKIYYDGIHVMQDYLANQEMAFYGQ